MIDTRDGQPVGIPPEFLKRLPTAKYPGDFDEEAVRKQMEPVIPREHQGAILREGEMVTVKGDPYVIKKIIKKGLVLHGVPSQ